METDPKETDQTPTIEDIDPIQAEQPTEAETTQEDAPAKSESLTTSSPKRSSSKLIILALVILFVIIVGAISAYFYLQSAKPQPTTQVPQSTPTPFTFKAEVQYLTGSAYKLIDDRRSEILEGDVLNEADVIETDADSRIVLSLDDGSVIRIDESSKITLSALTSSLSSVAQSTGYVFYRVQKDEAHKFEVVAGEVKIESLGTAYSVEKQNEVTVKVFEDKVKVLSEDTEQEVSKDQEWDEDSQDVTEIDKEKLAESDFYQWSLKEENLATPTPSPTPKPTATAKPVVSNSYKIKAFAKNVSGGIEITWESSVDSPKGYKVVKNLTGSPVYPGDDFKYLNDANARSVKWELQDGKLWHFRVCQYLGGSCGEYSNDVTVTASGSSDEGVSGVESITLSSEKKDGSTAKLNWSVEGTASKGYKVCWSTSSDPTYPAKSGDWATPTSATNFEVGSLESGKTYYFRVCELLSGTCGTYSNQASLTF
ncbi:FecR domain-containing protein [Patescibacteria group bacterium]